jgi:hypothetical protein
MRVGLDLDNTLAGYDRLFALAAAECGYLSAAAAPSKQAVRAAIRALPDGERKWRQLQARVYGPRMIEAEVAPGAAAAVRRLQDAGAEIAIVSHKSRYAAEDAGGADLREAALGWLAAKGFFSTLGLRRDAVFFEDDRQRKLGRIGELGCTHFVDDLEEVLGDPAFPEGVERLLYAPIGDCAAGPWRRCASWTEVSDAILGGA